MNVENYDKLEETYDNIVFLSGERPTHAIDNDKDDGDDDR